ncbi:hypothetical protein GCM10009554_27670 [Kribbella koreensis]|uniref:Uncharacterized protein n=1 Tax=Kribbella koreensis TaxID=57909 RepID=A0ABN1Q756_9ACTN
MNAFDDDDELMAQLSRLAGELDAVPEHVMAAARAAILTRDLDSELAELVADSSATEAELEFELVRGGAVDVDRLLSFDSGELQVELEVVRDGDELTLIGQVIGTAPVDCSLEYGDSRRVALPTDELGRFLVDGLSGGPLRVRCRSATGASVATAWVMV